MADDAGSVRAAAIGVAALAVVTFVAALPNRMLGDDVILWEQRLAGVGWGDLLSLFGRERVGRGPRRRIESDRGGSPASDPVRWCPGAVWGPGRSPFRVESR